MPGGDGTGPMGQGPMTGRAAGFCAGFNAPGFPRWGGGRGRRNWFYATGLTRWQRAAFAPPVAPVNDPQAEESILKAQAAQLEATLENIRQRLATLKPE